MIICLVSDGSSLLFGVFGILALLTSVLGGKAVIVVMVSLVLYICIYLIIAIRTYIFLNALFREDSSMATIKKVRNMRIGSTIFFVVVWIILVVIGGNLEIWNACIELVLTTGIVHYA